MTQLVLLFAGFGLAYVVGHSSISVWPRRLLYGPAWKEGEPITFRRRLVELLECPACGGIWVGATFGVWSDALVQGPIALRVLGTGFAVAGFNYVAARIVNLVPPGYDPPQASDQIAEAMTSYAQTLKSFEGQARTTMQQAVGLGGTQPPAGTPQ